MKTYRDFSLVPYSTMRLQAVGTEVYEPESVEELKELAFRMASGKKTCHWLGAGSNVVFAERVETPVVSLMHVDTTVSNLGSGRFRAGCSVRIQHLVRFAQKHGYGGIEYLFSLPASLGGCVYMNAGRGRGSGQSIANVLETVDILELETGEIRREPVDRSVFGHRCSPYQTRKCLILGATLRLEPQPREETERRIRERLATSRKHLDAGVPSCGSVFCKGNRYIFRLFRFLHPRVGGLSFSPKTSNWIANCGNGTLADFKQLVGIMQRAHRMLGQKCELEIRIFE